MILNDADLLVNNPSQLLIKYEKEFLSCIQYYQESSHIVSKDTPTILQFVTDKLLVKLTSFEEPLLTTVYTYLIQQTQQFCKQWANKEDVQFIEKQDYEALIMKYQSFIEKRIFYAQNKGYCANLTANDVLQELNLWLLEIGKTSQEKAITRITKNFRGENNSSFRTFFDTVIFNRIRKIHEIIGKNKLPEISLTQEQPSLLLEVERQTSSTDTPPPSLALLLHQKNLFEYILQGYTTIKRRRLEFGLVILHRIPLQKLLVQNYYPNCSQNDIVEVFYLLGDYIDRLQINDRILLERLVSVVEYVEDKKIKATTYGKWYRENKLKLMRYIMEQIYHPKDYVRFDDFIPWYYGVK